MGLDWSNGHSNTEIFGYILDKMRVGITSDKSVVKDDKADEDAVKAGEKHKKSIERGFELDRIIMERMFTRSANVPVQNCNGKSSK
jgi:hypothetical protein